MMFQAVVDDKDRFVGFLTCDECNVKGFKDVIRVKAELFGVKPYGDVISTIEYGVSNEG